MQTYELILVFSPDLASEGTKAEIKRLDEIVKNHEGSILKTDDWGPRELAYPIKKKKQGHYFLFVIQANEAFVSTVERHFNIKDDVLRYLIVSKDKHAPDLSDRAREQNKATSFPNRNEGAEVGTRRAGGDSEFFENRESR